MEQENKTPEQKLRDIIREKIYNPNCEMKYDGFDMSGFNSAHFHNLNLIGRFEDYMSPLNHGDWRNPRFVIPTFWKGSCDLLSIPCCNGYGEKEVSKLEELTSESTEEIIFKTIVMQNPDILKDLGDDEDKKNFEEFERDLNDLIDKDSNFKSSKVINSFKRNLGMVRELKNKHKKCQICGFTFKKKNGENYNETHHIIPLSENGKDEKINTLVLCANCHRQLHYAEVDITKILQGKIKINGEWKQIEGVKDDGGF